jgi:UDPglucose 6-dehydrogenase
VDLGWIGLGKLGLPCALVLASRGGHRVTGYDISRHPRSILHGQEQPPCEEGLEKLLDGDHELSVADSIAEVVEAAEVVFVAVQTPHGPDYGGDRPAPAERRDFEYQFLVSACRQVCAEASRQQKKITMVVVSTVLPGTCDRLVRPLLGDYVSLVYNPFFIAMGTVIRDFCAPEFVLAGSDNPVAAALLMEIYGELHDRPVVVVSIPTAELVKVSYNTFISMKVVFANMIMEICHRTGADCDNVVSVLGYATERVISTRYLRGGMVDGGPCHPRDLIAMSWLSERLDLSCDFMGDLVRAREAQAGWLADVAVEYAELRGLPLTLVGKSYKPETSLTDGSPALLVGSLLSARGRAFGHYGLNDALVTVRSATPRVFLITTQHAEFTSLAWPEGSVVIDPFGYIRDRTGVTVIRVGRK